MILYYLKNIKSSRGNVVHGAGQVESTSKTQLWNRVFASTSTELFRETKRFIVRFRGMKRVLTRMISNLYRRQRHLYRANTSFTSRFNAFRLKILIYEKVAIIAWRKLFPMRSDLRWLTFLNPRRSSERQITWNNSSFGRMTVGGGY